jgi:hypothetical protein
MQYQPDYRIDENKAVASFVAYFWGDYAVYRELCTDSVGH